MSRFSIKSLSWPGSSLVLSRSISALVLYSLIIFFVRFGDAMMAYFSPVFISSHVNSPLLMGIILASSSVMGFFCDIVFGEWFRSWGYDTYLFWGIVGAIVYPLCYLLLPPSLVMFLLAVIVWGTYYECILFSNFHFVNHFLRHEQHALGWGVLYGFIAAAYMIAPFVSSSLLSMGERLPLYVVVATVSMGLVGLSVFRKVYGKTVAHDHVPRKHIWRQIELWRLLFGKVWPVLLVICVLTVLDSVFWSSGAVLSEHMKDHGYPGGVLFVAYLFPALFMGALTAKLGVRYGKKRIAFWAATLAGVMFMIAGAVGHFSYMLALIALGSIFVAVAIPEMNATVEDYIARLGPSANSMIGLENAITSIAFVIGPLLAGLTATFAGHQFSFSVIGFLLFVVSLVALQVTPRKIRLPQQAIQELD